MGRSESNLFRYRTETGAHLAQNVRVEDDFEIDYPNVIAYSPRPGTAAAGIPAQVPPGGRKRRSALGRERGRQVWKRVADRHGGAQLKVLIEGHVRPADGRVTGRAANYFPVAFDLPQDSAARGQSGDWA